MSASEHSPTKWRKQRILLAWLGLAVLALSGKLPAFQYGGNQRTSRPSRASRRWMLHAAAVPVLVPFQSNADVIRLVREPLPKAFSESAIAAAKALKEALEAEEAVGDSFIGPEQEAKLAGMEQTAGKLVQRYGERYISEDSLSPNDPLRKNQVHFEMEEILNSFEAAVKTDKLPKYRKELIERLQNVLDLAEKSGVE